MSTFLIPDDPRPYPTLGPAIVDLMEASLVFGPGDLRKQPYVVDDEARGIIYSLYEVYPRNHPQAGHRLYDTACLMLRKGARKSEIAGALIAVELHPEAPVRCDGWRRNEPVGRPITDPYIPVVAYSEGQAEDTAWKAIYTMLSEGPHADLFDIGIERIKRADGSGEALTLSTSPNSRDGARTTFQVKEEIHRWALPRQLEAHQTMSANLAKRPLSEPWEFMPTTAYQPGQGSLGELIHDAAKRLAARPVADQRAARFWFFYRWADERIEYNRADGTIDQDVLEQAIDAASGPVVAQWSPASRIAAQWSAPAGDPTYSERVWLNRVRRVGASAFDLARWKANFRSDPEDETGKLPYRVVDPKAIVVAGFDGSRTEDWSALIATEVSTGFQWVAGIWDPQDPQYDGEVPVHLVDLAVDELMSNHKVHWLYYDPPYWRETCALWRARYGEKVVLPWETYRNRQAGEACRDFSVAVDTGAVSHDGDPVFAAHVGNARRRYLADVKDDKGERLWTISKEREHSPHKIDAVMAAIISWRARLDAIAAGVLNPNVRHVSAADLDAYYGSSTEDTAHASSTP